jgi:hypothetical protein
VPAGACEGKHGTREQRCLGLLYQALKVEILWMDV